MLNVILVDDEELARKRMRMLLDELDQGIHVIGEASHGREAIKLSRKLQPDLILLDIQMPVLDGFDVVELMGSECPPVIFVTA
ncbi:MAG: response regulator, partial [Balneolales bacterium]